MRNLIYAFGVLAVTVHAYAASPGEQRCLQLGEQLSTETDRLEEKQKQFYRKKNEELADFRALGQKLFAEIDAMTVTTFADSAGKMNELGDRDKRLKRLERDVRKFNGDAEDNTMVLGKSILDMKKLSNASNCQQRAQQLVDRLKKLKQNRRDDAGDISDYVGINEGKTYPAIGKLKKAAAQQLK